MRGRIFLFLICFQTSLFAQTLEVLDFDGNPLPFAHISYSTPKLKKQTGLTDASGKFGLPSNLQGSISIYISYLGYKSISDTLNDNSNKSYLLKRDNVTLNQFVVTSQYAPESPEKSVHQIRVLDRKRIDAQGAVNLRDVLTNETNLRVYQDNILGSQMSMQGLSGQNVKILVDGVPVVGRLDGNIDLSQLNLSNVERIEIVEGPLSVTYGTDALAGTINLITKKELSEGIESNIQSYYESIGQYNVDGSVGFNKGGQNVNLNAGRYYFDGWSDTDEFFRFPKPRLADTNRISSWNPKEQKFGKLQWSTRLGKLDIRPYAEYFQEKVTDRGSPRLPYYETAFDDYFNTTRINGGLDLQSPIGKAFSIHTVSAFNYYDRNRYVVVKDLTNLETTPIEGDLDTTVFHQWMSRGSLVWNPDSGKIRGELGYDLNYTKSHGQRISNGMAEQGQYAIFTTAEWHPLEEFILKPGLRYGYNTSYDAPIIPSLNILWTSGEYKVRASYARGFRAPTLKELHFEFVDINHNIVGNEELKAENSNNYQINISRTILRGMTLNKTRVGGYYNDVYDQISLAQEGSNTLYTYRNIGHIITTGFTVRNELSINHLKWTLGFNERGVFYETEGWVWSPEIQSNVMIEFHKQNITLSAFYKFTGQAISFVAAPSDAVTTTRVGSFQMLDITASKSWLGDKVIWSIGGKNLLDVKNIALNGNSGSTHGGGNAVPVAWGRSVFTSLKLGLNK